MVCSQAHHPALVKMRVLTLTPFYPSAADEASGCFVAEAVCALETLGVESSVIAVEPFYRPRSAPNGHPAHWVRYAAIPGGIGLASAGRFLYPSLLSRVWRRHQENKIDLIHAHAALPCGHAAALLSRQLDIPFVVTVHGLDAFFVQQAKGAAEGWCQRTAQSVYQKAARVICISHKVADVIANSATQRAELAVVHNGVDPQRFLPAERHASSPVILSVGNLIPIKGHELLVRAFAAVHERHPQVTCEIIGDGPERSHLVALANQLGLKGKVLFRGRQNRKQVAEAMQRCTVFALPSRYEGLGCVYLEAMSAEKPAIACRGQGIEGVIRHRYDGWLIEPSDLDAMTDALALFLQDSQLRAVIGSAARSTILSKYTLAHQAARLAQVYQECVA